MANYVPGRRAGTKTRTELYEESRAAAAKQAFVPRLFRMLQTLIFAAVMAGLAAICLALVDAALEIDGTLERLEYDVSSLNRTAEAAIERQGSADQMAAPRTRFQHALDTFPENADRIIRSKTPWGAPVTRALADVIDLVPNAANLNTAYHEYVDQITQALGETARTPAALELRDRLLDMKYESLQSRISIARDGTRGALNTALFGLQFVTLLSIAVAGLAVGLSGRE
jgi:hypothetical protein